MEENLLDRRVRIGIDTGGTFTDLVLVSRTAEEIAIKKVLTTPDNPAEGVVRAIDATLRHHNIKPADVEYVIHGTTLVTNALIARTESPVAFLATEGFRDLLEIRREHRYDLYDLSLEFPAPLSPRYLRFDIPERMLSDGTVQRPVDTQLVERLADELNARGIKSVAVCFLHSFTNRTHEEEVERAIRRRHPGARISLSSEVASEIREYDRASTTVANAYVQPLAEQYLENLQQDLGDYGVPGPLLVMQSNAGTITPTIAKQFPIRLLESGPAAGILAAASIGATNNITELLAFDMGGTTAKLSAVENSAPKIRYDFEVDRMYRFKSGSGLPVRVPVVDMIEIGAGGGSIASVDSMGLLKVGPKSAGPNPGPCCYGLGGTRATVTDADLILGYLDADFFLGGEIQLDRDAATQAIGALGEKLGLTMEEAAWGVHAVVNESMANAARVHLAERGLDPGTLPLMAFGGAGPVHAFRVAQALGNAKVIIPPGSGVASAYGLTAAPLAFEFVRSHPTEVDDTDWDFVEAMFKEMQSDGAELLAQAGIETDDIEFRRIADVRYVGQGHELRVEFQTTDNNGPDRDPADEIRRRFGEAYRRAYQREGPPVPIEVLTWRLDCRGPKPSAPPLSVGLPSRGGDALKGSRLAYFPEQGGFTDAMVYDRYRITPGTSIVGPAIIEETESTTVVPPGLSALVDTAGNLVCALGER